MNHAYRTLFLLVLFALVPSLAHAQVSTGTPPFGSFGGGPDIINLANLNSRLAIPVLHRPGRGMDFNFDLTYSSSAWFPVASGSTTNWQPLANWGWDASEVGIGHVTDSHTFQSGSCAPVNGRGSYRLDTYSNWTYWDGFGTPHPFKGTSDVGRNYVCDGTNFTDGFTETTGDGSGFTLSVSGATITSLVGAGGHSIDVSAQNLQDRNGNQITSSTSSGTTNYYDTLSGTTPVFKISGSGTPSSPNTLTYTAPSGASAAYTMKYTAYTVKTNFGCSGVSEYGPTANNLVSEIDLPDGSKYTFSYEPTPGFSGDVTGRLKSVTLPTGGTITYTYTGANNGIICADGSAAGLTRTTPDGAWTYARSIGSGAASTTTVTDPQSNQTQIQFQGIYETQRKAYQGSSTSGTLLRTVTTCYNGNTSNCTGTAITLPITSRIALDQIGASGPICKHAYDYNTFGLLTEQDDFDYGATAPGALLRKELIAYAALGNNIVNQPSSITIQDGGGHQIAKTTNAYDEGTPATSSGTPQHVAVSGSRGNLTSVSQWVQGSTTLTSHFSYFDTGTPHTSTDVNGALNTFNYAAGSASCANSFPTSINEPLGMTRSMTWNCGGGVQLTSTDENSKVTTTTYSDPDFWRPASVSFPDGGLTSLTYTSATSVTTTTKMNSSQNIVATVLLDGLGRTKETQLNSDPQGVDYVDTTYDVLGRVASVSNPHRSTSSGTDGVTSYQYDALNRPTSVTLQDGSVTQTSYLGNMTTVTDPAGKLHRSWTDALGRLVQVNLPAGSPVSLGTPIRTYYSYDSLDNLTAVTQAGLDGSDPSTWRTRTFAYDGLSRLTSETNPETGTKQYFYDATPATPGYNCQSTSPGDLVKTYDANGQTMCYASDTLHRLVQQFDAGPMGQTTSKYFIMDSATVNGVAMSNAKGRIAEAFTANCFSCGRTSDEGFSYDSMGRVSLDAQRPPMALAAGTTFLLNYAYDLAGNMTSKGTGNSGVTFSQAFDTAGRATQLTSSFVDAQHPATLAAVDSTLGYYPVSAIRKIALGNGLTVTAAYNSSVEPCRLSVNSSAATLGACTDAIPSGNVQDFNLGFNSGSSNNGNVASMIATGTQNFSRTYGYDALNRLASMNDSNTSQQCRGLSWTYDAWGNRTDQTPTAGTCGEFHASANPQNQIVDLVNHIYQYDADGELTADGSHAYTYDSDNRLLKVDSGNTATYTYDALGHRVQKTVGSAPTNYVYDLSGNVVAEVNNVCASICWAAFYASMNGQLIAEYKNSTTYFFHQDHLGSTRLVTGIQSSAVPNGGFEQAETGWTPTNSSEIVLVTDITRAHSGNNYVQISNADSTGGPNMMAQGVAVTPGSQLTFGGWVYLESGGGGALGWWLQVEDANHNALNWIPAGASPTTSGWVFQSNTYTVPSNVAYVQLYATVWKPSSSTVLRIDDAFLGNGGAAPNIVQNLDYLPFGELNSTDSGITTHKFTGDERDAETSLDHTQFRQYTSQLGRWITPDPAGLAAADPMNPQSWNRYAYVLNNPTSLTDASGLCVQTKIGFIGCGDCDPIVDPEGCNPPGGCDPFLDPFCGGGGGGGIGIGIGLGGGGGGGGGSPRPRPSPLPPAAPDGQILCQTTGDCSTGPVCQFGFCSTTDPQFGQGFLQMPNPEVIDEGWQFLIRVVVWGTAIYEAARVAVSNIHLSRSADRIRGIPRVDQLQRGCKLGRTVPEPSRSVPGGKSIEQEYICSYGVYTIQTIVDAAGKVVSTHVRPGPPKGGG